MTMMISIFQQPEFIVFALATILGSIVWFVRLEGRVNYGEKGSEKAFESLHTAVTLAHKRIDDNKEKHEQMETRLFQEKELK
jgi:hypothetical protein